MLFIRVLGAVVLVILLLLLLLLLFFFFLSLLLLLLLFFFLSLLLLMLFMMVVVGGDGHGRDGWHHPPCYRKHWHSLGSSRQEIGLGLGNIWLPVPWICLKWTLLAVST